MEFYVTQVRKETSWHIICDAVSYRYSFVQIHAGQLSVTGKVWAFGLPRVPFVNCRQFMYLVISFLVLRAGCGI